MWKVMIADDELNIRMGLRTSIERLGGFSVVAEAEDGEMALDLALSEKPDILLIDIRMPFMNGLELIEKLNENLGDCIIIIVSGHDEFAYAQKAIALQVFDYVLKPVDQQKLKDALERAAAELASRRDRNRYIAWASLQLEKNMPVLRERFLLECLAGHLTGVEIGAMLGFLKLAVPEPSGVIVLRVADRLNFAHLVTEGDQQIMLLAVRKLAQEIVEPLAPWAAVQDDKYNLVIFSATIPTAEWATVCERLQREIESGLGQAVITAKAVIAGGLEKSAEAYEEAIAEINRNGGCTAVVMLAEAFIQKNYRNPELSLEDVAAELQMSPSYVSKLMKEETGCSFIEYLTRIRVNRAVQLLGDPAVKVFEAAEAVGYGDQHYFSRAFKKVLGVSPLDYRKGVISS
jgi:two-component system, response regulator YesN